MNAHADKTQENKTQAVANSLTKLQSSSKPAFQFIDNRPEAAAQRKLQDLANNSPQVKKMKQLQKAANISIVNQQPIQRQITFQDGRSFDNARNTKTIIEIIEGNGGTWEKELGGTLASFLNRGNHGPYEDGKALLTDLQRARKGGENAQVIGKEREERVAKASGGSVADTGRYGQDKAVHLKGSDRHVKLDIESASEYGIVGGPGKANNLQKFKAICQDLKIISEQDGKTPKVYCSDDTPDVVANTAREVVGASNVINLDTQKPWDFKPDQQDLIGGIPASDARNMLGSLLDEL